MARAPRRQLSPRNRARADGRKVEHYTGGRHRLWRCKSTYRNEIRWVRWQMNALSQKVSDSIVHRYGREVGFRCQNDGEVANADQRMMRNGALLYKPLSTEMRTQAQCQLECYALEHHATDPYCLFLGQLQQELTPGQPAFEGADSPFMDTRELIPPSPQLLLSLMHHMRDGNDDNTAAGLPGLVVVRGRQNKASSIDARLKSLSGVMMEFGQPRLIRSPPMKTWLETWKEAEESVPAASFHLEDTLPLLWDKLWSRALRSTSRKKRTEMWARLLVQISLLGRSSDVTGRYCPLNSTVKLPTNPNDYTLDGIPLWIQVGMTKWKSRKRGKTAEYQIRIYANPRDLRFCPVHWLLEHWKLNNRADERAPEAPILKAMSSTTWRLKLQNLFGLIGHEGSSHSVRRSAAMWAARCGASLYVIKNIGRWEAVKHVLIYVAEGRQESVTKMKDNDGVDPIWAFWPFNRDAMVSTLEIGDTMLAALNSDY